jgi:hypothetical protein
MTPEQQEALDATAAERAPSLGLPHVVDDPQPYHAGALTPAYHVPGNMVSTTHQIEAHIAESLEPQPANGNIGLLSVVDPAEPSAADLDAVAAEESAREATLSVPTVETKEYSDGTTATGVAPLPDQSPAQQAEQEQTLGNA